VRLILSHRVGGKLRAVAVPVITLPTHGGPAARAFLPAGAEHLFGHA
jgi:hypothetical protein